MTDEEEHVREQIRKALADGQARTPAAIATAIAAAIGHKVPRTRVARSIADMRGRGDVVADGEAFRLAPAPLPEFERAGADARALW